MFISLVVEMSNEFSLTGYNKKFWILSIGCDKLANFDKWAHKNHLVTEENIFRQRIVLKMHISSKYQGKENMSFIKILH